MAEATGPDNRWAWVEVDLGAVRRNTHALKALLSPRTRLMCSVKADGYGHGAVACAKAMRSGGADAFAVATVAEGIELRAAGEKLPILMLNQCPIGGIDSLIEYDIMPTIYDSDFALAYGERAAAADKVGKYHMAIDTGMTRIGVAPEDAVDFRYAIDFHRGLECAGTFTHFATADVPGNWDFELQVQRFADAIEALRNARMDPGLVHCDNTPGLILHPKQHFDMARAGIGLYGLHPADTTHGYVELEPAMSVYGRVTRVVYPPVGMGVSYGATWRVPRTNIQVATVPMGYGDGLSRTLSNRMDVLCAGQRLHQVGTICMDQFMFAVEINTARQIHPTHPVEVGDLVTIIGRDGSDYITADDMARARGTINYEVTCDFGLRMEKLYV